MMLAERLLEHGIRPRGYRDGSQKLVCPRCSHIRKHKSDPCLTLTTDRDGAVWNCHHCGWSGAVSEREDRPSFRPQPRRPAPVKPTVTPGNPTPALLHWFAKRGISAATVQRNRIWAIRHYIPALRA